MSGIINSAGSKSGIIGNIKTLSGETFATPSNLSNIPSLANSSATNYTLGTLNIPNAGIWKVDVTLRMGWNNFTAGFIKIWLDGAAGGSTLVRMVIENPSQSQANANLGTSYWWIIDVKTGNTFNYTVTLTLHNANSDSDTVFHVNDSNGVPSMTAIKLRDTTSTGTGMAEL